jgi:hypothetical protein
MRVTYYSPEQPFLNIFKLDTTTSTGTTTTSTTCGGDHHHHVLRNHDGVYGEHGNGVWNRWGERDGDV